MKFDISNETGERIFKSNFLKYARSKRLLRFAASRLKAKPASSEEFPAWLLVRDFELVEQFNNIQTCDDRMISAEASKR